MVHERAQAEAQTRSPRVLGEALLPAGRVRQDHDIAGPRARVDEAFGDAVGQRLFLAYLVAPGELARGEGRHQALPEVEREDVLEPRMAAQRRDLCAAEQTADTMVVDPKGLRETPDHGGDVGEIEIVMGECNGNRPDIGEIHDEGDAGSSIGQRAPLESAKSRQRFPSMAEGWESQKASPGERFATSSGHVSRARGCEETWSEERAQAGDAVALVFTFEDVDPTAAVSGVIGEQGMDSLARSGDRILIPEPIAEAATPAATGQLLQPSRRQRCIVSLLS